MSHPPISPATPDTAEADLSGRQLGDFALLRRLGRGAMAEVYLAQQASLRRQVAVKVLLARLASDETYVRRFHHEAQSAASLVHANIVQIYEVGCHDGLHYIAQEYVEGQSLRELIARRGPLDVPAAISIMRQVALALDKAAARGLVHRDIKPENILLATGGEVKVADFGLARLSGASELNMTQVGMTMGTPLYMSPEQVEGRPVDPRSDIYSFGVTAFHMLSGEPPFRGDTALGVAVQHLQSQPRRLETLRGDLPPGLCRVVHTMLAKDPRQRYGSPRELLADLRSLQIEGVEPGFWHDLELSEGLPLAADPGSATAQLAAVMKSETLSRGRTQSRRALLALGLVGAFVIGALVAWSTREPSLLAGAEAVSIPKQESAQAQFFFAQLQPAHREAWLKSVEEYFPTSEYFVTRSRQELARYCLQQNRLDEAYRLFSDLARRGAADSESRAFGLAGQSIVLSIEGKQSEALEALAELGPLRQKLDARMARLLVYPLGEHRKAMDARSAAEWDQWVRRLPKDEATESPSEGGLAEPPVGERDERGRGPGRPPKPPVDSGRAVQ